MLYVLWILVLSSWSCCTFASNALLNSSCFFFSSFFFSSIKILRASLFAFLASFLFIEECLDTLDLLERFESMSCIGNLSIPSPSVWSFSDYSPSFFSFFFSSISYFILSTKPYAVVPSPYIFSNRFDNLLILPPFNLLPKFILLYFAFIFCKSVISPACGDFARSPTLPTPAEVSIFVVDWSILDRFDLLDASDLVEFGGKLKFSEIPMLAIELCQDFQYSRLS